MAKLLVLGATGRRVVARALADGHAVTAVVRDTARWTEPHPRLRVTQGDATDAATWSAAAAGHDAVICALGAPGRDGSGVRRRGTAAALAVMEAHDMGRIVVLSSYGVGDSRPRLPWWIRFGLVPLFLGPGFADHEAQEALVRASGRSWAIVRPPFLTDGDGGARLVRGDDLAGTAMKISRADVAAELVRLASATEPSGLVLGLTAA
jgi:nucleoside-diphosphate-sugar epimerase